MLTDIIEAVIFASGKGMTARELYKGLGDRYARREIDKALLELKKEYSGDRGVHLIEYNDTFQFQSNPEYGTLLADLLMERRERELSKTLLQVLALIAYKQPVTRAEIEEIRGSSPDYVVAMLLKLDLIEAVGRKETVGRPVLYGTTDEFLRKFGLTAIADLPDYDDLMEKIRTNFDKFYAKTQGLYRERTIDMDDAPGAEAEVAAADLGPDGEGGGDEYFEEDSDEIPDFLAGEDIVDID